MIRWGLGLFVAFFLSGGVHAETVEKKPASITIGFNPGGDPVKTRSQALEFAKELQGELSIPVDIFISKNYDGLVEAMKTKKIDFAFFTAVTFVDAEAKAGAKVLLKKVWADSFYFSALIARKDRGPKNLNQLKGQRIAYVDEASASGSLYPRVMLRKKGIKDTDFAKVIFSGNHAASIALLENGEVDVAAVFADDGKGRAGAWTKFAKNPQIQYRTLWMSEAIPNDPFCVRQEFYNDHPMVTHSLMLAMIDIFDKNRGRYGDLLGSKDLMPATSRQYDTVREIVKTFRSIQP